MSNEPDGAAAPNAICCARSAVMSFARLPSGSTDAHSIPPDGACLSFRQAEADDKRGAALQRHALEGVPSALLAAVWLLASPVHGMIAGLAMACATLAFNRLAARLAPASENAYEIPAFIVCGIAVTAMMAQIALAPVYVTIASMLASILIGFWPARFHHWFATRPSAVHGVRSSCPAPCAACAKSHAA